MTYQEFKECIIKEAENASITDYEIYYTEEINNSVEIYKNEVKGFSSAASEGVCFRCIVDGNAGSACTELFTEESARELIAHGMENGRCMESEHKEELYNAGGVYGKAFIRECKAPSPEEMTNRAFALIKAAYEEDKRVADGTQSQVIIEECRIELFNSRGVCLSHRYNMALAYLLTIVTENGEMYDSDAYVLDCLENIDLKALASKGVKDALEKMNPDAVKSGIYDIVFSGKMMASILSTFASVFSAEQIQKGLSLLKDKEGGKIADTCVNLVDDPFYKDSFVQMPFDAEGVPSHTKYVIENGILKTVLHNMKSAAKSGCSSTGNGLKQKYSSPVTIMPFHFYIEPGSKAQDELFKQAGKGIFITSLQGMHAGANPSTGDFSLAAGGFLIEEGRKSKAVKGFTVSGNFYELLKKIGETGSDLEFLLPRGVSVFGSPSVLVHGLSIAGE